MDFIFEFFTELFMELLLMVVEKTTKKIPKKIKVVASVCAAVLQGVICLAIVIGLGTFFQDGDVRGLIFVGVALGVIALELIFGYIFSKRKKRNGITNKKDIKELTIYGENRTEHKYTRGGCRGVVVKDGKILLSHETETDMWMIPGGGIEDGEALEDCCRRELLEETGYIVEPTACYLKLCEYYGEYLFYGYYFICEAVGEGQRCLTEAERERGLIPEWIPLEEAFDIFSRYGEYADINEEKRGTYLREYTGLLEYMKLKVEI